MLEPSAAIADAEARGDTTARLAWFEEQKSMPWGAIWDYYCESRGVPVGLGWLERVRAYERDIATRRAA